MDYSDLVAILPVMFEHMVRLVEGTLALLTVITFKK